MFNFPPDQTTSTGQQRNASRLRVCAANLKAKVYGIPQLRDRDAVAVVRKPFTPKSGVKIDVTDAAMQATNDNVDGIDQLNAFNKSDFKITPLEFGKDDDSNLHMDFIVVCSNFRATNYKTLFISPSYHRPFFINLIIIEMLATHFDKLANTH